MRGADGLERAVRFPSARCATSGERWENEGVRGEKPREDVPQARSGASGQGNSRRGRTSVIEGRFGGSEKPKRHGGSRGEVAPRSTSSRVVDAVRIGRQRSAWYHLRHACGGRRRRCALPSSGGRSVLRRSVCTMPGAARRVAAASRDRRPAGSTGSGVHLERAAIADAADRNDVDPIEAIDGGDERGHRLGRREHMRSPSGRAHMTSIIGPSGPDVHAPTTSRSPDAKPAAPMWPASSTRRRNYASGSPVSWRRARLLRRCPEPSRSELVTLSRVTGTQRRRRRAGGHEDSLGLSDHVVGEAVLAQPRDGIEAVPMDLCPASAIAARGSQHAPDRTAHRRRRRARRRRGRGRRACLRRRRRAS